MNYSQPLFKLIILEVQLIDGLRQYFGSCLYFYLFFICLQQWHGLNLFLIFQWLDKPITIIMTIGNIELLILYLERNSLQTHCDTCILNNLEVALFLITFIFVVSFFLYFTFHSSCILFENLFKVLIFCVGRNLIKTFISSIEFVDCYLVDLNSHVLNYSFLFY